MSCCVESSNRRIVAEALMTARDRRGVAFVFVRISYWFKSLCRHQRKKLNRPQKKKTTQEEVEEADRKPLCYRASVYTGLFVRANRGASRIIVLAADGAATVYALSKVKAVKHTAALPWRLGPVMSMSITVRKTCTVEKGSVVESETATLASPRHDSSESITVVGDSSSFTSGYAHVPIQHLGRASTRTRRGGACRNGR